jgi:hypothetical protein
VKDPITYIYLFAINLFTNLANLLFLTPWYVASRAQSTNHAHAHAAA